MKIREQMSSTIKDLAQVLDGVAPNDDTYPTPCEGLNVAELRDHVIQVLNTFVVGMEDQNGNGAATPVIVRGRGGEQVRELARRIEATQQSQPKLLFLGGGGLPIETAFPMMLDEFLAHGWDLAVATNQPFNPDPDTCAAATAFLRRRFPTDASRGGMYGPRVDVPPSASALDQFLGESGRDPERERA